MATNPDMNYVQQLVEQLLAKAINKKNKKINM